MFRVIIIGGEDTENYNLFRDKVINLLRNKAKNREHIVINTIGDEFVDEFTTHYGIDKHFFITDWKSYGNNALKERNETILNNSDALIFFQNTKKDLVTLYNMAVKKGIVTRIIKV